MTEYTEEQKYWIWMASVPEITPKAFYHILSLFGCAEAFFEALTTGSSLLKEVPEKILSGVKKRLHVSISPRPCASYPKKVCVH